MIIGGHRRTMIDGGIGGGMSPDLYLYDEVKKLYPGKKIFLVSLATGQDKNKSKIVLQYSLDGTFIKEWKSTMDVERNLGFAHTHISECCRGEQAYAYGYLWKYKKEID